MRHPEPDFVTAWLRGEVPKCCHTCLYYSEIGVCTLYDTEPPEQFARTIKACDQWESFDGVPF
jgi:hypothetical protein